jgi:hypothetical protein
LVVLHCLGCGDHGRHAVLTVTLDAHWDMSVFLAAMREKQSVQMLATLAAV